MNFIWSLEKHPWRLILDLDILTPLIAPNNPLFSSFNLVHLILFKYLYQTKLAWAPSFAWKLKLR